MSELPTWVDPAFSSDAQEAMAKLSPEDQATLHALGEDVFNLIHDTDDPIQALNNLEDLHPEAIPALEALRDAD